MILGFSIYVRRLKISGMQSKSLGRALRRLRTSYKGLQIVSFLSQ